MKGEDINEVLRRYQEAKYAMRKTPTAEKAEETRLWELVNEAALTKSGDQAAAVVEADRIVELVRRGRKFDEENLRRQRADERRRRWRRWKTRVAWVCAWAAAAGLIAVLVQSIYWMEGNDYAGFDQKFVNDAARDELVEWYGEERLPKHVVLRGKARSHFYSESAWKVTFFMPGAEGIKDDVACVFVWDGSTDNHAAGESAVREGNGC